MFSKLDANQLRQNLQGIDFLLSGVQPSVQLGAETFADEEEARQGMWK